MREPGHIFVTGATGFIGQAVCARLVKLGHRVKAAVRDPGRAGALPAMTERVTVPDLSGGTDWGNALDGSTGVIHLVSPAGLPGANEQQQLEHFRSVNVEGSARLARAAAVAGVRRFVYMSTLKVNGETSPAAGFTENDVPKPQEPYAISKWEAEQRLKEVASETGLELVVLRPPIVYGSGARGNFLALMRAVARGIPLPLASVRNRRSLLYVGNLVDAIVKVVDAPQAAGRTYLVSDGEDVSTPDLVREIARALGVRPRLLPCPIALLRLGAAALGRADDAARLLGSLQVDSSKIRRELGWNPRFSLDEGLEETARWLKSRESGIGNR